MKTLNQGGWFALLLASLAQVSRAAPIHVRKDIAPPPPGGNATYGRTLTGDFDGDGNPDVLYQRGTVWDVAIGVGVYEARMESLDSPLDCDVMRHQDRDRWLTLGAAGLETRRMHFVGGTDPWQWMNDAASSTGWAGASRVRVWSDDGLEQFVVGLNASSSAILVEKCNLSLNGDTATWSAFASIAISQTEPVVGIELFDRNGDGTPELAVRRAARLDIYSIITGARVAFHNEGAGWSAATMAPIRHAGVAQQWLALLSNSTTPGLQRFATVGLDGVRNGKYLTGRALRAVVAADVSGDGLDDTVWSSSAHYDLTVVTNTGGVPDANGYAGPVYLEESESTIAYPTTPIPPSMLPNHGTPWVSDFDLDGDIDVGLPVLGASELWSKRTENASSVQLPPTLRIYPTNDGTATADVGAWVAGASRRLNFEVSIPPPMAGGWWDTTKFFLEMTLWSQADPSGPIESVPFEIRRVALPASANDFAAAPSDLEAVPGSTVPCPLEFPCAEGVGFDRIVYLRVQLVRLRAGKYSAVTPATVYALHAQEPLELYGQPVATTPNGDAVQALLNTMPEGSVEFVVTSPDAVASTSRPPPLGKRVGLGGHVPSLTAPIDESPVGNPN